MTEALLVVLMITGKVAVCATLVAVTTGVSAAFVMHRFRFPGRELVDALLALPMVLPPTVLGYYLLVVLGRRGTVGRWLYEELGISLIFTWQGAVLAAAIVALPLVYQGARAAFEGVSTQLENAARVLGAGEFRVLWRVTLPLAWPGIVAGSMLAFARAMGEFGATLMVAGSLPGRTQTLSLAIYDAVQAGKDQQALLLVGVASAICVVALTLAARLMRRRYA